MGRYRQCLQCGYTAYEDVPARPARPVAARPHASGGEPRSSDRADAPSRAAATERSDIGRPALAADAADHATGEQEGAIER
jgi:hypothetical protein